MLRILLSIIIMRKKLHAKGKAKAGRITRAWTLTMSISENKASVDR